MLVFVIVAVFVAGLLVGRTPEYLGHKIEPFEMKMASAPDPHHADRRPGVHCHCRRDRCGEKRVFRTPVPMDYGKYCYAFTSQGNNNGSAFAGLNANTPFYNCTGRSPCSSDDSGCGPNPGTGRFPCAEEAHSGGEGTLAYALRRCFIFWLIAVILVVGALNFLPAAGIGTNC